MDQPVETHWQAPDGWLRSYSSPVLPLLPVTELIIGHACFIASMSIRLRSSDFQEDIPEKKKKNNVLDTVFE